MLEAEDFKKLVEVLNEFFYSKEENDLKLGKIEKKIDNLTLSADKLAQSVKGFTQENTIERERIVRLEKRVKTVSEKLGIATPF